ncbi:MAG TPA: tetratricopeptide repeat protein [Leptolyngbyaceae cyanobacterium]
MDADDISKLVDFADRIVYEKTGQHLEAVDKDILQQTLKGKKLNAIQCPTYENSYVQRFRAPKLWERLSVVTGETVRKKTVLEVLQRLELERSQHNCVIAHSPSIASVKAKFNGSASVNGSLPYPELLINQQQCEPSPAEHSENQKVGSSSSDTTTQDCQSSGQNSQTENSQDTNSSNNGLPRFMNFIKPGVALLLSASILSCLFALSWLANWYGVTNHLSGQLPQAQFGYSLALKLNPLSPAAHYNQAATYEDQHNYPLAQSEYQLAIKGGLIAAYNNMARLYILQGNYDAAISLLRVGLPLAKDDIKADMYKNRGWARLEQSRYDEAKLDLTEAIKLKSDRASAYCLLAQVLERQTDKKGALSQWENCLGFAYQPKTPEEDKWVDLARQRLKVK